MLHMETRAQQYVLIVLALVDDISAWYFYHSVHHRAENPCSATVHEAYCCKPGEYIYF